ncbi:MAG: hypothetical protein KIG36_05825 [Eubacteriales bacterium]|nr:hypothetical protein [Eubacteriales bacterium]
MEPALWKKPPSGYGEVAFFWWHGDRITREKLTYILEQLRDAHISGLQINYAHGDSGGRLWGLTLDSSPRPFSEEWWDLLGWFLDACRPYGISISLSDYTLASPGQGFFTDEILAAHPEFLGQRLSWDGERVMVETVPWSLNPLAPGCGEAVVERFYGEFERRFPGETGRGINYFFSDELNFNIAGNLWCDDFAEQFAARKGYDLTPFLPAIFTDIGPETPKVRLDYKDVIVRLEEERYFEPVGTWHADRGMTFGCDHGGRGKDVTEFGDYFRTAKWYTAPGNDQPHLACDIIKNKVNSSIAHLNGRRRTWLEGFYGSGWGTSSAQVADAVIRNFLTGQNLLSLHGLYYSMDASSWEWAPPCNHWHMPYWPELKETLAGTERLSWLLSQGEHVCDAAVYYPVAAAEADPTDGEQAVRSAFAAGEALYAGGIDFDFVDFTALEKAEITDGRLCIGGEAYRALILPGMKTVRDAAYRQMARFARLGGVVVLLGDLPEASDRIGRNDPELTKINEYMLKQAYKIENNDFSGMVRLIEKNIPRDMTGNEGCWYLHRRIGEEDVFLLYGGVPGARCRLRAVGEVAAMDWKTGDIVGVASEKTENGVAVTAREGLNVFLVSPTVYPAARETEPAQTIGPEGEWHCRLEPTLDNAFGDYAYPPEKGLIGPEARRVRVRVTEEDCSGADLDDADWESVGWGEGRYFTLNGRPYRYSLQRGNLSDPGPQHSYHGLKGRVGDDVLCFGESVVTQAGSDRRYEGEGPYVFETTVSTRRAVEAIVDCGAERPAEVRLDGKLVSDVENGVRVRLTEGRHRLTLRYERAGRTHFMLRTAPTPAHDRHTTSWYRHPGLLTFDAFPDDIGKTCWMRLTAPPGMEKLLVDGFEAAYADGVPMKAAEGGFVPEKPCPRPVRVALRFRLKNGSEDGAVLNGPIRFACGEGLIRSGDWSKGMGLDWYSGGVRYWRDVTLKAGLSTILDLKKVNASAVITVNGERIATLTSPPFRADITRAIREGQNRIEILVHNTLAPQMSSTPSVYVGETVSGMGLE